MFFAVNQMLDFVCEFFFCFYNHFKSKEGSSVLLCAVLSIPFTFCKLFFLFFTICLLIFLTGVKNKKQKVICHLITVN